MHEQMRKYYERLQAFTLEDESRRALVEQQAWLAARIDHVAEVRIGKAKLNLTDKVIPDALDLVFPDIARRQDGRALWFQMSGDAHVLGWSTAPRGTRAAADRTSGLAVHAIGGSTAHIAQPFIATYELLRAGWSLYDRRCEGGAG
jgi:hypothetical protein